MAGSSCEPEGFPKHCWWCPRGRTIARPSARAQCFRGSPCVVTRCSHAHSCLSLEPVLPKKEGASMTIVANPYLQGNYAPVHEELTATDLAVSGSIPEELCGRYLRNGPNPP